ncbi:MAG: hypothetical protein ACXU8Z_10655, partial [Caulobacteraceae bacterium]
NVVDLGVYGFERVQLANAAQSAAQAAWTTWYANSCTYPTKTISNCGGNGTISAAITNAIKQSSVLGLASPAQFSQGTPTDSAGYYCPATTTNVLTSVGSSTSCPSGSANQGAASGYYDVIRVTFTYHPLFGSASVANLLGTTMIQDTYIRLQ